MAAFAEGLLETGYVEGQDVVIEYRWAEGHPDIAAIPAGHPRADVPAGGRRLSGRQQGFVEKRKAPSAMGKYAGDPRTSHHW